MDERRKLSVFIATSLDGYIAGENESLDWLFQVEGEGDNGIGEFYDTVDTILMGRKTYDWIMKHEKGEFSYKGKECYVFSRSVREKTEYVTFVNESPAQLTNKLKSQPGAVIWLVGGGELLHHFLKENLVDELILTVAPAVLGSGTPLFGKGGVELDLTLKRVRQFNQFVELSYQVNK